MKKHLIASITLLLLASLSTLSISAQAPEGIIYQAEARDSKGTILRNKTLEIKITILADFTDGTIVWEGYHNKSTDHYGLFSLTIGEGTSTYIFSSIDWANHKHFLNVEVKYKNTWSDMGTSQFLSVPYALHAETVKTVSNLPNPTDPKDPVTKEYIDMLMTAFEKNGISFVDFVSDNQFINLNQTVSFQASSTIDANSWNWDFGDGHTADVINPTHVYTNYGKYSITLTASNGILTRSIIKQDYITVRKTVLERLEDGESPKQIYDSDHTLLDSLYGNYYKGGLIFYLNTDDGSGMVAAETNINRPGSNTSIWGHPNVYVGYTSDQLGAGDWNTNRIIEVYEIRLPSSYPAAAKLCYDLILNGYDDWFLPSVGELDAVCKNLHMKDYGNFPFDKPYWSSWESGPGYANAYYFPTNKYDSYPKLQSYYVRPVREFSE